MTPQEIWTYKLGWLEHHSVPVHSDLDWLAKLWCRRNLEQHQWDSTSWTAPYELTYNFERLEHSQLFEAALATLFRSNGENTV